MKEKELIESLKIDTKGFVELVKDTERKQREEGIDYTEHHIRQSIVHMREDIVLLVAHLDNIQLDLKSFFEQLNGLMRRLNILIALMIIVILFLAIR